MLYQKTQPDSNCTPAAMVVMASLLALSSVASAQPDAGTLLRQIEQAQPQPLPRQAVPSKPLEPEALKAPEGLTVVVKEFRFAGNTLLTNEQLAPVVASYLNRPVGLGELRKAAAAVADAYRLAGWIVRAYLPQQEIRDGIVTIQIVEAVFSGAVLDGAEPHRFSSSAALRMIDAAQPKGTRLNAGAIDRALLLIDDLPGIAATGSLRAGREKGETELAVKLADEPLTRAEAGIDNAGSRATGPEQFLANLNINSPLGYGDLVTVNVIHTKGSDYLRLAGSLPAGGDGLRIGINASALKYRLVATEFVPLHGKGTSGTVGLEASYPLIRSRLKNLYLSANADDKAFDNQAQGATTTRYRTSSITLGLAGNLFDNAGGGGVNSASIAIIDGNLNLDGSPNQASDAATTRTAGRFTKLRYSLSRQQVVMDKVSLYAALSGQLAGKNLDSSEKFYLGGMSGVRAYPAAEGGGSEGEMLNLELRWKLSPGFSVTPFYDWGRVRINRDNGFAGAPQLNAYSLNGAGAALAWQWESGATAKAVWARRLGNNPNPSATGLDQDGTLFRDRLWLSLMMPF